jgi:hypothetical protein
MNIGLEANSEKPECTFMSSEQNSAQNSTKTANKSFENVAQLKYLGATLINQNWMNAAIKSRLNSVNA